MITTVILNLASELISTIFILSTKMLNCIVLQFKGPQTKSSFELTPVQMVTFMFNGVHAPLQ